MEKRIIKFKAKRLDNGEWVEGYYYKECGNTYIIEDRQEETMLNRNCPHLVDPSTVCQFTGLEDKNGKEVWEADYLKPIYDGYKPMKVIIEYGSPCLDVPCRDLKYLPLAICDIRCGNRLVELEIENRKEEK